MIDFPTFSSLFPDQLTITTVDMKTREGKDIILLHSALIAVTKSPQPFVTTSTKNYVADVDCQPNESDKHLFAVRNPLIFITFLHFRISKPFSYLDFSRKKQSPTNWYPPIFSLRNLTLSHSGQLFCFGATGMGVPSDDAVVIQKGKKPGDPYVITVNCPDKTGLGCDICRTVLDFGLYIYKGDVSTDGIWCYIVLWVVPHSSSPIVRWANLKERLLSVCPSCSTSFYLNQPSPCSPSSPVYLLKFCSLDRNGLLHDVTHVLSELELSIQRVKVTTTPDGHVLDLFFITDNLELLRTKERQDETREQLQAVLGDSCISCELQLASSQCDNLQIISSLSPVFAEELFGCELSENEIHSQALSPDMRKLKKACVTLDNSLSPAHTLLQINCVDHKGFLYDIMRTLKDSNIQIAYGRISAVNNGQRELDLFVRLKDGKKIVDPEKQDALCSRLKVEMLHPLRVVITNRGPDTELLVANPVELSGKGRPRVFYDVTLSLKSLGICIFSAEIGRHSTSDREWEVYRFLLDENCRFSLSNMVVRNQIVDKVRRTLMGWRD